MPVVKVAFVRDLSMPDADEHALPASQAIRLAFETAMLQDPSSVPVELEEFDLAQDAADLESIDADPSYVGVIVAPGVNSDDAELDTDLPVLSLSGLGAGDGRRVGPDGGAARHDRRHLGRKAPSVERLRPRRGPPARSAVPAAARGLARRDGTDRRSIRRSGRGGRGGMRRRDLGRGSDRGGGGGSRPPAARRGLHRR